MNKNLKNIIILCTFFVLLNSTVGAAIANRDVIIGFKNPVGPSEKALIQSHGIIKSSFSLIPAVSAKLDDVNISEIKRDPRVKYVEDDKIYEIANIDIDEYSNSWGARYIGSDLVAAGGNTGTGIKVAVLDTGIDCSHEDLINNCHSGYNFYFNNTNTLDDNWQSHGTHIAGIIAAEKNGIGIVGVAPEASVYAVKVMGSAGFGAISYIISGIEWSVNNSMDIATMSVEGRDYSQALNDAVNASYDKGLLLVAAAGNNPNGSVTYPAAFEKVIAVTAIDGNDRKAYFSPIDSKIELAAPGVDINSTVNYSRVGSKYAYLSGTSMAAPYVAGVAALIMKSDYQDINGDGTKNNKDIRILLDDTARDVGDFGKDNIYGYGIVDASNATLRIPNKITLSRTENSPMDDKRAINLSRGNYTITIHSDTLVGVQVKEYQNGSRDLISVYNFSRTHDVNIELNVENNTELTFIPFGVRGSIGFIKVKANF